MKKLSTLIAAAAFALMGAASAANAALIDGSISMAGGFKPTGSTSLESATGIDFDPNGTGFGNMVVVQAEGDLAGLNGMLGAIKDFAFAPFTGPITAFYTVNGLTFDLLSVVVERGANTLTLRGKGLFRMAGFDDTEANWIFTGQGNRTFSWSATSESVPEPATLILFGSGLLALGLRRRLSAQA